MSEFHPDAWVPSPAARAAAERATVVWTPWSTYREGEPVQLPVQPGVEALGAWVMRHFPGVTHVYARGRSGTLAPGEKRNRHREGLAIDLMVPEVGGRANRAVGDPLADFLLTHADAIGVGQIIWDRTVWMANQDGGVPPRFAPFPGPSGGSPHTDHLHVELTREAGAMATPFFADPDAYAPGAGGGARLPPWAWGLGAAAALVLAGALAWPQLRRAYATLGATTP